MGRGNNRKCECTVDIHRNGGTYGGLSQPQDITDLVIWHNDNPSVLTLDPGSGNAAVASVPGQSRPRLRQLHRNKQSICENHSPVSCLIVVGGFHERSPVQY